MGACVTRFQVLFERHLDQMLLGAEPGPCRGRRFVASGSRATTAMFRLPRGDIKAGHSPLPRHGDQSASGLCSSVGELCPSQRSHRYVSLFPTLTEFLTLTNWSL